MAKSFTKDVLKLVYNRFFSLWEKMGFHVTPVHYYMPIPDTSCLHESLWQRESQLIGIDINEKGHLSLLQTFSKYKKEYEKIPRVKTPIPHQYFICNKSFGSVDGEVLYCLIRDSKPKRILEVGSGFSTMLMAQAIRKTKEENSSYECLLVAVDPFPNDVIKGGFSGFSRLITSGIQDIPLSSFEKLEKNDILFIDSSHVVKIGNDVQYLYLEVLPRLQKGVIVQIHDIFLPSEYPKELIFTEHLFWTEQYLLQAFLTFNDHYNVMWSGSYMNLKFPNLLEEWFSSYRRDLPSPGSCWMRKIK